MFTIVKDIPVNTLEDGLPALLTIILMPLTYDITVGIGAGFITWVLLKVVRGKMSEIHPLMWVVSIAFVVYFIVGAIVLSIVRGAASGMGGRWRHGYDY